MSGRTVARTTDKGVKGSNPRARRREPPRVRTVGAKTVSPASIDRFLDIGPYLIDVETTGLKADYGMVLVIGVRKFRRNASSSRVVQFVTDIRERDMEKAERKMLLDFRDFMDYLELMHGGTPCIITFNGTRFDIPFVQARLAIQGIPLLPKMRHLDMLFTAKRTFAYTITSRRSKYMQALFRVGDPNAPFKDSSELMVWLRATFSRNPKAFAKIIKHNRNECLRSLDYQVRKFMRVLPRTVSLK